MKRVLIFMAILVLPLSVMAMTQISDSDMSNVTGQAGVSINADVTMNLSFGETGWGDSDGYGADAGGWIGNDSINVNQLHIWPRTDFTMESDGIGAGEGGWSDLQFLTFDVVTLPDTAAASGYNTGPFFYNGQAGLVNNQVTALRIGVPTFTITMEHMTSNIVIGPNGGPNSIGGTINGQYYAEKAPNRPAYNQIFGKYDVAGLNMAFGKDGAILIYPHGNGTSLGSNGQTLYGSGVTLDIDNVNIAYMLLDHQAWGDLDGAEDVCLATSTATSQAAAIDTEGLNGEGWIGIRNLAIENVTFNGKVLIDVGTLLASDGTTLLPIATAGTAAFLDMAEVFEDIYNANWQAQGWVPDGGKTFVAIGVVNGFNIHVDQLGLTQSLGPTAALGQDTWDVYIGDVDVTVYSDQLTKTQSFLQLFAH